MGEVCLAHARRVLAEIDDLEQLLGAARATPKGLMRAEWDIEHHLRSGRLVQVLPQYQTPDASIHAVYPQRHQSAARVRAFVDFVAAAFEKDALGKAWSRDACR